MIVNDVAARIDASIGDLRNRVSKAAELAALVSENKWPQQTPAAFVIPLGFDAAGAEIVTGMFRQALSRGVAVVLFHRASGDATGEKTLTTIDALEEAVLASVAGWSPAGAFGVLTPRRGRLVSMAAGAVIYQIDFAIDDQLRITR